MRRCTLMLSTDPSYDNRTIASTLKMQIQTVQCLRAQLNASGDPSNGYGYGLWCGPHHATSHLQSRLESQHQSVPGCAEVCGDPLVYFVPFSHWPPPPSTWTRWTTSFGHTSRKSPTWPLTTPESAWSPPSAEYSPSFRQRLWKRHAPSSGSISRRWLKLTAATLNRCQLDYITKLSELIFSIKVLK